MFTQVFVSCCFMFAFDQLGAAPCPAVSLSLQRRAQLKSASQEVVQYVVSEQLFPVQEPGAKDILDEKDLQLQWVRGGIQHRTTMNMNMNMNMMCFFHVDIWMHMVKHDWFPTDGMLPGFAACHVAVCHAASFLRWPICSCQCLGLKSEDIWSNQHSTSRLWNCDPTNALSKHLAA